MLAVLWVAHKYQQAWRAYLISMYKKLKGHDNFFVTFIFCLYLIPFQLPYLKKEYILVGVPSKKNKVAAY